MSGPGIARAYSTPRVLDQTVRLAGYDGALRQIAVLDLGHEEPTILLTNPLERSSATPIGRYAKTASNNNMNSCC